MKKNKKNLPLLKPDNFSPKDENNPKNIDIEEVLDKARKKRADELATKKIILNGKEE